MTETFPRSRLLRHSWTALAAAEVLWLAVFGWRQSQGVPAYLLIPIWAFIWAVSTALWRMYFFERAQRPLKGKMEAVLFAANLLLALFVLLKLGPRALALTVPVLAVGLSTLLVTGLYLYRNPVPR